MTIGVRDKITKSHPHPFQDELHQGFLNMPGRQLSWEEGLFNQAGPLSVRFVRAGSMLLCLGLWGGWVCKAYGQLDSVLGGTDVVWGML